MTTRGHVHWVVTEHGAVNLHGRTMRNGARPVVTPSLISGTNPVKPALNGLSLVLRLSCQDDLAAPLLAQAPTAAPAVAPAPAAGPFDGLVPRASARPRHVGPDRRLRGPRAEPGGLLRRRRHRRPLEDRRTWGRPSTRSSTARARSSIGDVAIAPDDAEPRLGRHRREQQPAELLLGRRRLQVDRWRQELEEHGAPRLEADRPDPGRPGGPRRRLRRGPRRPLEARRRARHLQDHRRRADLDPGARERRRRRRHRPGDGPQQQQGALRRHSTSGAARPGASTAAARAAASGKAPTPAAPGPSSPSGIPVGPLGRIGLDVFRANPNILYARIEHEKESGRLPLRRRRRHAGRRFRGRTRARCTSARSGSTRRTRTGSTSSAPSLHYSDDGGKTFKDRRRPKLIHVDFHAMWIDPANPDHLMIGGDGGVGISLRPREDLRLAQQPARRAVLPRRLRHGEPLHRLRRPPGQQHLVRPERGALQETASPTTTGSWSAAATGSSA